MQNRYSRQIQVEQIGHAGQDKLSEARVLIIGAGGLGCTVGSHLAGAGVGQLTILDHDTVEESNLHRQILFRESDIGQRKAGVAARELKRVNTGCDITAIDQRLSTDNVGHLCDNKTVIVDAADNFVVSYLLSDACEQSNMPLVSASVNKTFGYVGQFCCDGPSLRAIFPRLPKEQTSCDLVGVTGPSVGVIASIQAQEVLKAIVGDQSQLMGKLLYVDAWNYSQQIIDFSNAHSRDEPSLDLVGPAAMSANDILLDVRSSQEVIESPFLFSQVVHIPLDELEARVGELASSSNIVCACKSGQRALVASQLLLDAGFESIRALVPS